jgi:hypothetical protein
MLGAHDELAGVPEASKQIGAAEIVAEEAAAGAAKSALKEKIAIVTKNNTPGQNVSYETSPLRFSTQRCCFED